MLLSSALPCDASQPQHFLRSSAAFNSPPSSPPNVSAGPLDNIVSTCRSLQSLIATPPSSLSAPPSSLPMSSANQLPTPPMTYSLPPLKLRLRSRPSQDSSEPYAGPRKRIVKRNPPRGANKRRRDVDDDMGRDDIDRDLSESESESEQSYILDSMRPIPINFGQRGQQSTAESELPPRPSTPKASSIAPPQLPLGLDRSDFHEIHHKAEDAARPGTGIEMGPDGEPWSVEDDRILIELVLEKLKLSKAEWEDCARSLGKDHTRVQRRWKSLASNGDVVLKKRERRTRLHSTWR